MLKHAHARTCSTRCRVAYHRRAKAFPRELLARDRWVRFDASKRPLTVTGAAASSTNPETWSSHAEAVKSNAGVGLGFVLGDGVGCIDLDHCLNDGVPTVEARRMLDAYPDNYVEVSPSGDGLHVWGLLDEAPGSRRVVDGLSVEVYSVGRYITVTGKVFQPGVLAPISEA